VFGAPCGRRRPQLETCFRRLLTLSWKQLSEETSFRQMLRQLSWIQLSEGTGFRQMLRQFLHRGRRGDDGAPGAGSPHPMPPSPFPPSGGKGGTMPAGTLSRRAEGEHCARKGVS